MRFLRQRILWLIVLTALVMLTLWASLPSLSSGRAPENNASSGPMYTRKERFGIAFVSAVPEGQGYVTQSLSEYRVAALKVGWYSDWSFNANPAQPQDDTLEYVQLINVRAGSWPPDWSAVREAATRNRGATWIIGNEPEGVYGQGNRTPTEYAEIYHEAYTRLKSYDRDARIAIGGVIEPTPLRLRWIEEAMAAYQARYGTPMEVDVWNIHVQILQEKEGDWGAGIPAGITPRPGEAREYDLTDCASIPIFKTLVTEFRTWMKDKGQRNKPLIISEMGVLQPSDYIAPDKESGDQRIEQFMAETFDWLLSATDPDIGCPADENRLVQRWLWFSLNGSFWDQDTNPRGFNGSLYDYRTKRPNRFGLRWIYYQNPYRLNVPFVRK